MIVHQSVPSPVRRSKWASVCALVALPLIVAACDSVVDSPSPAPTASRARAAARAPLAPPKLETSTPTYPASVMYIVYREYAHLHPETRHVSIETDKDFQKYVEKRLRKLYPTKGYDGMMTDILAEASRNRAAWAAYERDLRRAGGDGLVGTLSCDYELEPMQPEPGSEPTTCPGGGGGGGGGGGSGGGISGGGLEPATDQSWTGSTEFVVSDTYIPTVQEYVDSLQTEGDETETLYYYESLADPNNTWVQPASAGKAASRDDMIRATASQGFGGAGGVTTQSIIPAVWVIGPSLVHCAIHVLLGKHRAEGKQAEYYPGFAGGDDRADAFRHIYISMYLRRYCSAAGSWAIMDGREWFGNNSHAGRTMDYHNNYVGRQAKYEYFRGHWFWDRWDWKEWSRRVRDFVNAPGSTSGTFANGVYFPQWAAGSVTNSQIDADEASVPTWKYVYFR
ncbi:MAG TPA: hypothetical protein VF647_16575 [Longimicrobium sp.]|jgi:hypothetical protein